MSYLSKRTNKFHKKFKSLPDNNDFYAQGLEEVLKKQKNSKTHVRHYNSILQANPQNDNNLINLKVQANNLNKRQNKTEISGMSKLFMDRNKQLTLDQQKKQRKQNKYKLPHLIKNKKKIDLERKRFKTADKQLIQNYMNAILIQVGSLKKKTKSHKKYRQNIEDFAPVPIKTMNSPKSMSIPKNIYKQAQQLSSRTEQMKGLNSEKNKNKRALSITTQFLPKPKFMSKNYSKLKSPILQKEELQNQKFNHITVHNRKQQLQHKKLINQAQQWLKVNPFQLQTYFFKLKHKNITQSQANSKLKKIDSSLPNMPNKEDFCHFIKQYVPINKQINIQQLVKQTTFQIIFQQSPEGSKWLYFGETMNDDPSIKEGLGIIINNNLVFQGLWKGDVKVNGVQKSKVGIYKGDFKNNKRDGQGQYFWFNGEYYSGQWKQGKKSGSGYWKSPSGQNYMGQWYDGQVNGFGIHKMKNGRKYEGQFMSFLKHGSGKQVFPNGDFFYGEYSMGQPHGTGTYQWKNGYTYKGQFNQGTRQGQGNLWCQNMVNIYGKFKKEKVHGQCKVIYANGDTFEGNYENSKRNGKGILKLKKEKKIIKGIWQNDEIINDDNTDC